MADLIFYTNPQSRGRIIRWMLEEVGQPYETEIIPYDQIKSDRYLAVNPMGKVPAIKHRGHVVTECAAICAYLADAFPQSALGPRDDEKADYYRWFFYAAGPVEQAVTNRAAGWEPAEDKQRMFGYGNFDRVVAVLDELLSLHDYVCGDRFTAADVYLGSQIMFPMQFGMLPERESFTRYRDRLQAREAYKRAQEIDGSISIPARPRNRSLPDPMDRQTRQQAIDLYDRFTHEGMERRTFMARMIALAGSAAAAEAFIASIAASPAAAAIVAPDDPRLTTRTDTLANGYKGYVAEPKTRSLKPTVIVIHENRGLNDHIRDIARRLALAGYRAVAPDMLSPGGGTPANEDAARDAIGKIDYSKALSAMVALISELKKSSRGGKVGVVGFCWGGAFVNYLTVAAGDKLNAAASYYGPAPDPAEAKKVEAPMLIHDAALDTRVNSTSFPWVTALREAGKKVTFYLYEGVNHAFNNDTSAERYNKDAATLAWSRTLAFFSKNLR